MSSPDRIPELPGLDLPMGRRLNGRGRACHGLVLALPASADATALRRRLPGGTPLWSTDVPARSGTAAAAQRIRCEALRPVRSQMRVLLLRFTDAARVLVLVGDREQVPRAYLELVADLAIGGSGPDEMTAPPGTLAGRRDADPEATLDWGLGDPRDAGIVSAFPLALPAHEPSRRLLPAALALTVARYGGQRGVELGYGDAALRVDLDESRRVTDYLRAFDDLPGHPAGPAPPPVGIVRSDVTPGRTYLPFLAPPFPLTVHEGRRPGGGAGATLWIDHGTVHPGVGKRFAAAVELAAERLAAHPGTTLAEHPLLTPHETAQIRLLGGGSVALTADDRIDDLFRATADRHPDKVALLDGSTTLTYRELDRRAGTVAAGLRAAGARPGALVGVCLDRNLSLVVAMLAVLKAGCAYVPMDPRYPPDRLRYVTADAALALVIGDVATYPVTDDVRVVSIDELSDPHPTAQPVPAPHDADAAAYVIYTSGSTGRPKGVVVPHRNVAALLRATEAGFELSPDDVWTLFHSSAFDFSVWEIWGCLLTGGRLVIVPHGVTRDTEEFHRLLCERRVTVLNQTPSAFSALVATDQGQGGELAVRLVVLGGEPLDVAVLTPWFVRHPPSACRVVNMFGITETTVHVTAQTITPAEVAVRSRSVGAALPGWWVTVRDPVGRILPPGPAGEIYVGGAGVADGYLRRSDLTAHRFIVDAATGERVYRSGDRGRLCPDGRLDHLGRLDSQVKIRGHRIELDEIRSVLTAVAGVRAAVVTVPREVPDDPATDRIDAFVVLDDPAEVHRVRRAARRILPEYMMPASVVAVAAIPLTVNGKPDLTRLAARPADPVPDSAGAGPDDLGDEILQVWARLLNTEIGVDDNFFEIGGNSLLVARLLAMMREKGLPKVSVRDFYAHSTAGRFVAFVKSRCGDEEGKDRPEVFPERIS